jgi:hypothetical protein
MRSGTTLMRLILSRHSELEIPPESHFLAKLFKAVDPEQILTDETRERALQVVLASPEWQRDWRHDEAALRRRIEERRPESVGAFIDEVFRLQIEPSGKPSWGDKTPAYLFQVERLRACFPDARFVAMVRDPRDVYLSIAPRNWVGKTTWQVGQYLRRCDALIEGFEKQDSRFTVVRYEDLVTRPEGTVRGVCRALGLDFEPSMLSFHEDAVHNVQDWELELGTHQKLLRPMQSDDVARWTREGRRRDITEVEAVCWDAISYFGYEPSISRRQVPMLIARSRLRRRVEHRRSQLALTRKQTSSDVPNPAQ